MKYISELQQTLVIDLETVKITKTFEELTPGMQQCWIEQCDKIKAENQTLRDKEPNELYSLRAALYPEFAKIISIGFGKFDENSNKEVTFTIDDISGHDEPTLLKEFSNVVSKIPAVILVAHNGKFFDFSFLIKRYLINGILIPKNIDTRGKKPWEIKHQDTGEIWACGNTKGYSKLKLICEVLGVPTSKDDIDGSQVGDVYYNEANGIDRIATYCRKDVIATAQIYLKMNENPIILDKNILSVKKESSVLA